MDRFLAASPDDRAQAFEQAGVARGLSANSVEKDFWVCLTLRELFTLPEYGPSLTFKGGTSLSKAWGLIDRFSEDIDLTIERDVLGFGGDQGPEEAKSRKEQQRRLADLRQACRSWIAEGIKPALTTRLATVMSAGEEWSVLADEDDPDGQTLLFSYPRPKTTGATGYVMPVVKLEFGARADPWPFEVRNIVSIVAEQFPSLFDAARCSVRALVPERTFWEKVMLLHEETFRPAGRTRRPRMARHYYDVWRLIEAGVAPRAVAQAGLFERVAAHRQVYFRQNWVDYGTLKRGNIRMLPLPEHLDEWRRDYTAMRGEMFLDDPPPFDEILNRIERFQAEFNGA